MADFSFFRCLRNVVFWIPFCMTANGATGALFDVTSTGLKETLNISLALNGKGPLSIQNYTVDALNLIIRSTIPSHEYSFAGIKINTPGYRVAGRTPTK